MKKPLSCSWPQRPLWSLRFCRLTCALCFTLSASVSNTHTQNQYIEYAREHIRYTARSKGVSKLLVFFTCPGVSRDSQWRGFCGHSTLLCFTPQRKQPPFLQSAARCRPTKQFEQIPRRSRYAICSTKSSALKAGHLNI